MPGQKEATRCKQLILMNYLPNQGNWIIEKSHRRQKFGRPAGGRPFVGDQNDEVLSRTLRQKIALAVDECYVWPNQNIKRGD